MQALLDACGRLWGFVVVNVACICPAKGSPVKQVIPYICTIYV